MNRPPRLIFIAEAEQSLLDDVLQVRLADIDDVVHGLAAAKGRVILTAAGRCRHPNIMGIIKNFIFEILVEQSYFPELVGNVFADVRHRAIGSDNDFVVFMTFGIQPHDPTACVFPFLLVKNGILFP